MQNAAEKSEETTRKGSMMVSVTYVGLGAIAVAVGIWDYFRNRGKGRG